MVQFELPVFHQNPFPQCPKNPHYTQECKSALDMKKLAWDPSTPGIGVCVCVLSWNGNRVRRWRLQWIDLMLEWFLLTRKWGFSSWRKWKGWVLGMNCWRGPSEAVLSSFRAPLVMVLKCYCSAVSCWQKSQITKKTQKCNQNKSPTTFLIL